MCVWLCAVVGPVYGVESGRGPGVDVATAPRASPCGNAFTTSVVKGNGDFSAIKLSDKLTCGQCSIPVSLSTRGW